MALSSNSNAGSTETKVGAGALSNFNTQNKSNGNFSGGDINFDTSKLNINNPFDIKEPQQPTLNVDSVFNPNVSGNLDIDLPKTNNNSSSINNTTYSNNSKEPTMTVDEVYGKSNNQPVVEKQGDYFASSNEKSNVETSTFGKQDEVSVTPTSVTENKGIVGNTAIQSVEGLDFQQKDKASVDVLDSKKKRDEVEAEDKADGMRNKLKANINNAKQEEGGEDFRIGDRDEDVATAKAEVDRLTNEKTKLKQEYKNNTDRLNSLEREAMEKQQAIEQENADYQAKVENNKQLDTIGKQIQMFTNSYRKIVTSENNVFVNTLSSLARADNTRTERTKMELINLTSEVTSFCEEVGLKPPVINMDTPADAFETFESWKNDLIQEKYNGLKDLSPDSIAAYKADIDAQHNQKLQNYAKETETLAQDMRALENKQKELQGLITDNEKKSTAAQKAYDDLVNNTYVGEETSVAETSYKKAIDAIKNSENATPEQQAQAEEALTNLEESRKELEEAAVKARSGNPADMIAYQEALEKYNKRVKDALKIGNIFTQTDFNKEFTGAVADANDFKVTLSDGTEMEYSDFAAEEATKSPQYAKVMYENKAKEYETNGHPILAKIERWKAKMSQTWLGSKLTFADNKVRNQFTQMAKTNMRATYATHNNVLNDTTGKYSEADKAEASAEINQAKALMTASAALQATTGFLSSIGDGVDDGIFGTTDPEARNAWQKTVNTVNNIIKITLGLGIFPAANKAYQNMYYIAGDEVNNSLLFNKDFDGDGFALCQEYGDNAATGMIAGFCELAVGIAMVFNPASLSSGLNLIADSFSTFFNGLYGVRNEADKSQKYTQEVLEYFKDAENIAEASGNEEAVQEITNAITQIENFELKADEVGNLDNWLEGSGSNTVSNEKFNQSLTYDEWLKLIEADPTMREYAKSIAKKKDKNDQKDNVNTRVNS